jgi:hypothetical protein
MRQILWTMTPAAAETPVTHIKAVPRVPQGRDMIVEEIVKQRLVTLIVRSLVLDEFRRFGWIYPSRHRSNVRVRRAK